MLRWLMGGGSSVADGVSGRVDLIRRDDDDRVSVVDLKSNHRSQAEEVTKDQLSTCGLAS